jgi:glutathione S-transferase
MITLHGSTPKFGLPSASPFVSKAEILLKMAGVPYTHIDGNFSKAPKGKIPFIEDDGQLLGDSTFIRQHLERRHGGLFDKGLSDADKAIAGAFEKLCEDHLYWAIVHERWMIKHNFDKGPRTFFESVPAPLRPIVVAMIHRQVARNLKGQGFGRHTREEILELANRDVNAIAAFLAEKPFLMGPDPCGADASVWSTVASVLCPFFDTPLRTHAESHANLIAYRDRGMQRWFPDLPKATS